MIDARTLWFSSYPRVLNTSVVTQELGQKNSPFKIQYLLLIFTNYKLKSENGFGQAEGATCPTNVSGLDLDCNFVTPGLLKLYEYQSGHLSGTERSVL